MSFFQRRKATKWHQRVSSTVGEVRPAPRTLSKEAIHLFPYSQLRIATKTYLGRWKRPQEEKDKLLLQLIEKHPCKEVAFAACAADLSPSLVQELLSSSFDFDEHSLAGLEAYLHAFVAAAQSTEAIFTKTDEAFASILVPVVRDLVTTNEIQPASVKALFSAWTKGPPDDLPLLSRTKLLTEQVCERVEARLSLFLSGLSGGMISKRHLCDQAVQFKDALALFHGERVELEHIVARILPQWRAWANWTPSLARLHRWSVVAVIGSFGCLLELEGPDLRPEGSGSNRSEWRGLIQDGEMLAWLEASGFRLGIGLITGDSEELLRAFIPQLLHVVLRALEKGTDSVALLQLFIRRDGLDSHTLEAWQAADAMLRPQLVTFITTPEARYNHPEIDVSLVQGLKVLSEASNQNVRGPLRHEIGKCVHVAASSLEEKIKAILSADDDWTSFAERLWTLREVVASSVWLHDFVDDSIITAGRAQPLQRVFVSLRDLQASVRQTSPVLQQAVEVYVQAFVLHSGADNEAYGDVAHELHMLWILKIHSNHRETALDIAVMENLDVEHRCACIRKLHTVPDRTVWELQSCFAASAQPEDHVWRCVEITRVLCTIVRLGQIGLCWRELLLAFLHQCGATGNGSEFTSLGFKAYRQWIDDLHTVLGPTYERLYTAYTWICSSSSNNVTTTLEYLESLPESGPAIHSILSVSEVETQANHLRVLQRFHETVDAERRELMQYLILSLRGDSDHSALVCQAVWSIAEVEASGFKRCERLMIICHENRAAGSACLAIWLRLSTAQTTTLVALRNMGKVLHLGLDDDTDPPGSDYRPAKTEYMQRVARLVELSQNLEHARTTLKRKDPKGVDAVIAGLKLEQPSGAATLIAELPDELVDVIEETSDDRIQFHFPLSAPHLSAMERLSFGLTGSETLVVYFRLNGGDAIDGFCVHVEQSAASSDPAEHTYFKTSRSITPPEQLLCRGRLTRLTYVVARELWRQLHGKNRSLEMLYKHIRQFVHRSASLCIVCGNELGASLHRGTLCHDPSCLIVYRRSGLDLRLEELKVDGKVADLLLTSIHAAVATKKLEVLPARPARLHDADKLLNVLNSLPTTPFLANATDVRAVLSSCGDRAELLVSWMLINYRGFLVSASGNYKIPNMGNVQQFLLVDGSPQVEAGFAKHDSLQPRHCLFHGTSMDRLYPVLAQGLRVLSGTPLQKHGAVHGSGIYLAREPSYALNFASKTGQAKGSSATFFDSRSSFRDVTVLLGCEHAGNDLGPRRSGQIHVVTDPTRVMVRYVFIVPSGAKVPKAQDIKIPMLSAFNSLRSTAVGKLK